MGHYDFDVIIPLAGDCSYLAKTIASIQLSSIQPNFIILIDDGIDSVGLQIIESFKQNSNIVYLKSSGSGIVKALNTGVFYSKANYLARLDGDDEVDSRRFEIQMNFLKSHSNAVVVGSRVEFIDEDSNKLGESQHPVGLLNHLQTFKRACFLAHPSTIIKREALIILNGYRSIFKFGKYDLCEDFDLWLRLSDLGEIWNLEECLTRYRVHHKQVTYKLSSAFEFSTFLLSQMHLQNRSSKETIDLDANSSYESFLNCNPLALNKISLITAKIIWQKNIFIESNHLLNNNLIVLGYKIILKILKKIDYYFSSNFNHRRLG